MTGTNPELVRQKVIGPAGTTVHLTIARAGASAPLEFDVTRAKIEMPSASGKMLPNGIAYIQITTFGENTTKELTAALQTLMPQNPKGLVLDLRDNGGGYLQTAVEVVSQFQDKGTVLYEQYGDGTKKSYDVIPGGLATKIPMVDTDQRRHRLCFRDHRGCPPGLWARKAGGCCIVWQGLCPELGADLE